MLFRSQANLDALKISSAFDKANNAVNNLIASFESGGSTLDTVINDIEAAQSSMTMGEEGKKAAENARNAVLQALPSGARGGELENSLNRSFDRLSNISDINSKIATSVSSAQLSATDPEKARAQLEQAIEGAIGTGPGADEIGRAHV